MSSTATASDWIWPWRARTAIRNLRYVISPFFLSLSLSLVLSLDPVDSTSDSFYCSLWNVFCLFIRVIVGQSRFGLNCLFLSLFLSLFSDFTLLYWVLSWPTGLNYWILNICFIYKGGVSTKKVVVQGDRVVFAKNCPFFFLFLFFQVYYLKIFYVKYEIWNEL